MPGVDVDLADLRRRALALELREGDRYPALADGENANVTEQRHLARLIREAARIVPGKSS